MNHPDLSAIRAAFDAARTAGTSRDELERSFLGKQGSLTAVLRSLGELPAEQRQVVSQAANQLRDAIREELSGVGTGESESIALDRSVPALPLSRGRLHPTSAIIWEMTTIFRELSFEVVEGPEILSEEENFEWLNIGVDHPSRDSKDTFYLEDLPGKVLRTQTTSLQVREMQKRMKKGDLPIRIVMPGKTYRPESDATHSPMFHQMDAVIVDTQTTFAELKGSLAYFAKRLFGDNVETRFRPHNFPFTEPSAEMDIRWVGEKHGTGKHTEWLEFGGCGMIHPDVLKRAGINPKIYQGWAFGMSVERPLMLRHQLPDLRRLYDNDETVISQLSAPLC